MALLGKILFVVIIAILGPRIYNLIVSLGFHVHVKPHSPGPCHIVPGIENGSEDIEILPDGMAIISSGLKWGDKMDDPKYFDGVGHLYLFDFNNVQNGAREITVEGTVITNPHGLGLWMEGPDDEKPVLFLIHHNKKTECVEKLIFDRKRKVLVHAKTYRDPLFIHLNDVVATGPDSFYVTNYAGFKNNALMFAETLLGLSQASVVHVDEMGAKYVITGFTTANGIALSPDKRFVYLASSMSRSISVYKRQPDNSLEEYQVYKLYSTPDNINIHRETGDLWIGALPVALEAFQHISDPSKPCSSQILRLKVKDGIIQSQEEVFADDGKVIFATSVGHYYNGGLLAGTVQHKLLYCKVNHLD